MHIFCNFAARKKGPIFRHFVKNSERNPSRARRNARFLKVRVRDYLPLQQGLRHNAAKLQKVLEKVRDYLPLQQGLRRHESLDNKDHSNVRDYLPLQQGLRLRESPDNRAHSNVRDYLPLQQGLRLDSEFFRRFCQMSETIFHYNKD